MISLKRLLERDGSDAASVLLRACSLLLEAIAVHAVHEDETAFAAFRDVVRGHRRHAEASETAEDVLDATREVITLLDGYNRSVESLSRIRTTEFHEMVRMLSRTLAGITHESHQTTENLGYIEKELQAASRLDDLRLLKGKLGESLCAITKESGLQREFASKITSGLRGQLASLKSEMESVDPVTGLADSSAAERAIEQAMAAGTLSYLGVLCMERLDPINARFGYGVGDRLMFNLAQDVAQHFTGGDRLFRWRGPTLVAVLERPRGMHDAQLEMSRLSVGRQERMVQLGDRSVLLSVTVRSTLIPLHEAASLTSVCQAVGKFAASARS